MTGRQGSLDTMSREQRTALADEIAKVSELLRAELIAGAGDPMHTVATALALGRLTSDALALLVTAARERGASWQQVGDALGTSRQAAFQRFGAPRDPRTGETMTRTSVPGAADRATAIFTAVAEHRWDDASAGFSDTVRQGLGATGLADAYAGVIALWGELQEQGTPVVLDLAGVTVVEVPLHHEAADLTGRVSFAPDGSVVGLWFVPAPERPGPVGRRTEAS